jgi:cytochrome o ubiquinol oxidase operon protein cyoD
MTSKDSNAKSYIFGFFCSVVLTLSAFYLVIYDVLVGWTLAFSILALAVIQLAVQLYFFLHLNRDKKTRWNMITFFFAAAVVLIVVLGSVWIMVNLSYHHSRQRTPDQVEEYIQQEEIIDREDLR